ncbi:MAG: hypothetical protein ABIV47_23805 [Roseiflexaceae bacterium]
MPTPTTEERQGWPEALRDAPQPNDRFPWRLILPWISGSAVLLVLLLTMLGYLLWRARYQILFLNSANNLVTVRADGSGARPVTFAELDGARFRQPQWAHDGRRFAALTRYNGKDYALVAQPGSDTPLLVSASMGRLQSLPASAWSPDDTRLAIMGSPNEQGGTALFLVDPAQSTLITADATLVPQVPLDWHPRESRFIITSQTPAFTPTLRIVTADGTSTEFAPPDQQESRSFGAWSPDGGRIAYVATNTDHTNNLRGGIWVANSDGSDARQIVKDGLNFAPIWSPAGDVVFFTRWLTQTDTYDLYRVTTDGATTVRVGAGTPAAGVLRLLEWSPDQTKLIFQSLDRSTDRATIWIANGDGSNPQSLLTKPEVQGYLSAHWAPTGRALLLVTPENTIVLHWLDTQRAETRLAVGSAPNWQP